MRASLGLISSERFVFLLQNVNVPISPPLSNQLDNNAEGDTAENIDQYDKEYAMALTEILALLNIISFLIGLFLGHWLAIGRDKRKEFNHLVEPVRELVYRKRFLSRIDIIRIRERLHRWKRKGFDGAVEEYEKSNNGDENWKTDGMGGLVCIDPARLERAAESLLSYLKPR